MLWSSPTWSFRTKLAGTFLFPGGLFTPTAALWLARCTQHCTEDQGALPAARPNVSAFPSLTRCHSRSGSP
jgi:hypothetical protein